MGYRNKDITITLRMDEETKAKLDVLCSLRNQIYKESRFYYGQEAKTSKIIRCLIDAVSSMPEEQKKELLREYYRY